METKALKKQMGAAIAMVLVAAIALGAATFAWFVTNNKVDATTSTISAQSNAAFMYIHNANDMQKTDETSATTEIEDNAVLFPAHWVTSSDVTAAGNYKNADAGKFYTAFGSASASSDMKADTLALVKCDNDAKTPGTPEAAEAGITVNQTTTKYAVKNTFYVGSKGANLSNLVVDSCAFAGDQSARANAKFDNAIRVLIKSGDNWVLCDKNSIIASSNNKKLADTVSTTETEVDMYLFYDGDDSEIYTNNLPSLKDASKNLKVTFSATSQTTDTPQNA